MLNYHLKVEAASIVADFIVSRRVGPTAERFI